MKTKDVVKQLENLKCHCQDYVDEDEPDHVWNKDVAALDKAIELIKQRVARDEIEMLGKTWINMGYHRQETNRLKEEIKRFRATGETEYKHDNGKPRLDLVPPGIIEAVGAIRTHGTKKYGDNTNWEKVEPERYRAAMMRHLCEYLRDPASRDKESGHKHLWHMACNIAFLIELEEE